MRHLLAYHGQDEPRFARAGISSGSRDWLDHPTVVNYASSLFSVVLGLSYFTFGEGDVRVPRQFFDHN
jgi:hypothetical protein